jgi:hypothetical protein
MKSMAALLFFAVPLFAQEGPQPPPEEPRTVLAIGGEVTWGIGVNGRAVGFALARAHHHVTIAARLGNGGGHAPFDAYLMRNIGPEATEGDEVARTLLDLPYPALGWTTLFEDMDLERGVYWLVIAKPRDKPFSSINWIAASPMVLETTCDIRYLGTRAYTFFSDAADYIPASKFKKEIDPYGFQIALTEPREEETECP